MRAGKKKTTGAEPRVPASSHNAPAPTGINIQAVSLRSISYREIPTDTPVPAGAPQPAQLPIKIKLTGQVRFHAIPGGPIPGVEFFVRGTVKPEPTVRPVEIVAELSLLVAPSPPTSPTVTLLDMLKYVNAAGLRTLYPYLREVVSSVTARGIYGPLFLDPVVAQMPLSDEQIDQIVKSYAAEQAASSASRQ